MHPHHIHKHRNCGNKNLICVIARGAERGQEASSPPVLRIEPSTSYTNHWISSTNPGLSACCLSQFWPAVLRSCTSSVTSAWLFPNLCVHPHLALVFPGDREVSCYELSLSSFVLTAVGGREWDGQWRTCLCLFLLLLSGWASRPFLKFSGMLITLV